MRITNHLVEGVEYLKTPNMSGSLRPEGIVLHDTAGPLDPGSSVGWLRDPASRVSAHFVVERDAHITQLAPLNVQTWHAGASRYKGRRHCNRFTVGIEIVNPGILDEDGVAYFDVAFPESVVRTTREHGTGRWLRYTPEQIDAVVALCIAMRDTYHVSFITTHWFVSPGRKVDPNPLFPLDQVRAKVFGCLDAEDHPDDPQFDAVTMANLNMRRWPSTESHVIKLLARDTGLEIIRSGVWDGDRWFLVSDETDEGWVHGDYLDID